MENILNKKVLLTLLLLFTSVVSNAAINEDKNFFLKNVLTLSNYFSKFVVVAEKSTSTVYLFKNDNGIAKLFKSYPAATGKLRGDKSFEGDKRTPEGIYRFHSYISGNELVRKYGNYGKQYGLGAFRSNYPNIIDRINKKTGGGIWLHSTDDDSRISKKLDSKGCVVLSSAHFKDISNYVDIWQTPMIIVHDLYFQEEGTWANYRNYFENFVNGWVGSWKSEDLKKYISYYDSKLFKNRKGGFNRYRSYKKAVFSNPGTPEISMSELSVLMFKNYAIIEFLQNYKSKKINDIGEKKLILVRNKSYEWKIVSETWRKKQITND